MVEKDRLNLESPKDIKQKVKEKYSEIAYGIQSGCCGPSSSCCGSENSISFSMIGDEYKNIQGYVPDADLGLGCGLPTEFAEIKQGDTVVDLGSGAGNDVFIVRSIVGESGKVIGIDMTEAMIKKARINNIKLGFKNVIFKLGEIENLPIEDNSVDVVVSNCVLNLVPNKKKAFDEIYRILKPGAHFCISDIVIQGEMIDALRESAELYVGCVAGALQQDEYLKIISESGFNNIEIKKSKKIEIPHDLLSKHLNEQGIQNYKKSIKGIYSITVVGKKANI